MVMEDGFDKKKLEKMTMPPCDDHMLAQAVNTVLTPGVWRRWN
jgi:hypothetical protein